MTNKKQSIQTLATDIANYLNAINNNSFTKTEVKEVILEYILLIQQNDITSLIDTLTEEHDNTNDPKALSLIKRIKELTQNNQLTYAQLITEIAKTENFDPIYTINNLSVKEVFTHLDNYNMTRNWNDTADQISLSELNK